MKANETKFQLIIEGTKQYVVPLFQRSYSWDKDQWDTLWDDLLELYEADNPRTHFIGSIVTMPTTSVPEGVAKFLLIDGQQRITTIFILLTLLRDRAKQIGQNELSEEINNTLLVNPYKKDLDYYKLQPTQADRTSFKKLIHYEEKSNHDQITNAYQYFERKLRRNNLDVERLKKIIASNLSTVSIVLDPDDNPHLVFESLNAKGRPLSQSDLIRNYFFMRIHVNEQDTIYSQYWKPMQDSLNHNLTEFIRHYLMKDGAFIKESDVYFSLKNIVSKGDALECLKDLATYAVYYEKLINPEKEENKAIREALKRLNRIEVTTAYPFLLNCYHDYFKNKTSSNDFISILKVIENYLIRRFVCNVPTNQLNKIFPTLYAQVITKSTDNFVEGLKSVLQTKGYPKDVEFVSRLEDTKLYGGGDRAIKTKLIIESIEESYNHKEQVPFNELTIEHVMPQTLSEEWQKYLGDDWEITYELLLHTIGNLTLTAYNSELSNESFEDKKIRLNESHLEINKYFYNIQSWKREDIERRSQYLSNIALKIWPYFGNEKLELEGVSSISGEFLNVTGKTPIELCILDQHIPVQSWRDVLIQTMNAISDKEPDKFEQILLAYPRFIGTDKQKFRQPRELKNGVFVEVDHMSARYVQKFCLQGLASVGLSAEDWNVIAN